MHYILILVLFSISLFAKSEESCYTVQLVSKYNNQKNKDNLESKTYPNSCVLMEIGKSITVRCGCYEKIKDANEQLPVLKQEYENAYIATTYKYRFENNSTVQNIAINDKPIDNKAQSEKKELPYEKTKQESKQSCYTVQLVSKYNNQNNRDNLSSQTYPQSCILMEIGNSLTVRCGCYEKIKDANEQLPVLKQEYKNAYIATTYKHRFNKNNDIEKSINIQEKKVIKKTTPKKATSKTCYTVQLLSRNNSISNKKKLLNKSFDESCITMEIGNSLTVRCGCYEKEKEAREKLPLFKSEYKHAYVASTYRYRFDKQNKELAPIIIGSETQYLPTTQKSRITKKGKSIYSSSMDEELKLILQAFLYNGDVENAYKTAKIGYMQEPNSYYWNEKMAETSRWSGRTDESIGYMLFLYSLKGDTKTRDELITYGNDIYQYEQIESLVVNKARKNPTDENIDAVTTIYNQTGSPEKAAMFLEEQYKKNPTKDIYLTKILKIYLEVGDLQKAAIIVNIMQDKKLYNLENALLISSYYYLKGDMKESYNTLILTKDKTKTKNEKFNQVLSDISWYIQDYKTGAEASKRLMAMDKARLVDYERVIFMYKKTDTELVFKASKDAYNEYKITYLFYGYADSAMKLDKYDGLRDAIIKIDKTDSPLKNSALYWLIKANVYEHYNKPVLRREALEMAILIDPDNFQNKVTLFWFFMENNLNEELNKLLQEMSEDKNLNPAFYMPLATAYLHLQNIDKANYYAQKLIEINHPISYSIDFKFLMGYIYQAQGYEQLYKNEMQAIVKIFKKQLKKNPKLIQTDPFLNNYLRALMFTVKAEKFEKKLKKAEKYLTKKHYNEISYSWAVYNKAYEKSHEIFQSIREKEVWLRFSNAQIFQNHTELENLLDAYLGTSSMGNVSQTALQDGQVALAQKIAYDSLNTNSYSLNNYNQHLSLSRNRSDEFYSHIANYNRNPLEQNYIKLKNKTYIAEGWSLLSKVNYFENSIINNTDLKYVPDTTVQVGLGVKREFERIEIEFGAGYNDSMRSYISYSVLGKYRISTDIVVKMGYEKNKDALDTIQLMLAGKKDTLSVGLAWNMFDSTIVELLYESNDFSSQDEVDVGKGSFARASIVRKFRSGYPDWLMGLYVNFGNYDEIVGPSGVMDQIDNGVYPVLPYNFYDIGATFSLGMQNSQAYTRVWRPYIEVSPYYNSTLGSINFSANAGYGGKIFHQDHLSVGVAYSETVYGTSQSTLELYLKYQFLYTHP